MSIKPVCPFCGLAASIGGKFLADKVAPRLQTGRVESDLHFTCGSCDTRFPAYAYTPGDDGSFVSNVVNDEGADFDPPSLSEVVSPVRRGGFIASHAQAA